MYGNLKSHLENELEEIKNAGLYKSERVISMAEDWIIKIYSCKEGICLYK